MEMGSSRPGRWVFVIPRTLALRAPASRRRPARRPRAVHAIDGGGGYAAARG